MNSRAMIEIQFSIIILRPFKIARPCAFAEWPWFEKLIPGTECVHSRYKIMLRIPFHLHFQLVFMDHYL